MDVNEFHLKLSGMMPPIFRRFEKIDWKQIASVNMDQLKINTDFEVIEKNICNILCCHIETEFDHKDMDTNLVIKLFKLAQISIEYLLQLRQQTMAELRTCHEKLNSNTKELNSTIEDKEALVKKIKELKKSAKKSASTYNYYRCPACSKTFVNGEYLKSHLQRRHIDLFVPNHQSHHLTSTQGNLIPFVPAAVNSTAVTAPAPTAPVISSIPPAVSEPIEIANPSLDEIRELKLRLQAAETKLETDKLLLNSIIDKVENSNVSLQNILLKEVEKICTTFATTRRQDEQLSKKSAENEIATPKEPVRCHDVQIQNSPIMLASAAAQTTPRLLNRKMTSIESPSSSSDCDAEQSVHIADADEKKEETSKNVVINSAINETENSLKSVSDFKSAKTNSDLSEMSDSSTNTSSLEETDTEDSKTTSPPRVSAGKEAASKKIDSVLFNRFKLSVENAFNQRLKQMGIETKKGLSANKYRRVIIRLRDNRQERAAKNKEFVRIRQRFEDQLQSRLSSDRIKKRDAIPQEVGDTRVKKITPNITTSVKKFKNVSLNNSESQKVQKSLPQANDESFNRAPVPTPRVRNQASSSFLMARNGEAADPSFPTLAKNVKDLAEDLEREIKSKSIRPPANSIDTLPSSRAESENSVVKKQDDEEEDSFSLSSLDEILAQLKQPKFQTSTPKAQRSVQWKEPVESSQIEANNSWDSL